MTIDRYLLNAEPEDEFRYKIVPTEKYGDRDSYVGIVDGTVMEMTHSRVGEAFAFFRSEIEKLVARGVIEPKSLLNCILDSMHLVFIKLDPDDQPYKIFESLNAKGKGLTQADLVRNYIAMRLPRTEQTKVFNKHWSKIEAMLPERRRTARIPELTAFLRHYLAHNSGVLPNVDHVYARFRDRVETDILNNGGSVSAEIARLHRFAKFYDKLLRPTQEANPQLSGQLSRLNVLESTTAYPLLLAFYDHYDRGVIGAEEFVAALKAIENFTIRRLLAGDATNFNKLFPPIARELKLRHDVTADALRKELLTNNYPSDNRLRQRLATNNIYRQSNLRRLLFVLQTLNRHLSAGSGGYTVLDAPPTVEHIMPQVPGKRWQAELGRDWQDVHREYLNVIGNLTIVTQTWNSKLSNAPFAEKSEQLRQNALRLNSDYFSCDITVWSVSAIQDRTDWLTELAIRVWPPIGSPPRSEGVKGTVPLTLTVRDTHLDLPRRYGWRGMLMQMVNHLHELKLLSDFDDARREFGGMIQTGKDGAPKFYKQSSDGWWIYVNLPAEHVVRFCGRLATFCGLRDDEWSFTYE